MSGTPSLPAGAALDTPSVLPKVVGSTTILLGLALLTYGLRMYSRMVPYWNLKWDDHTMTCAVAFTVVNWAVNLDIQVITQGRNPTSLVMAERLLKLGYVSRHLWLWSVTFIKVSVALMMLRIKQTRRWQIGISMLVATLLVMGFVQLIGLLIQCRPLNKNWNLTGPGKCWSTTIQDNGTYISSGTPNTVVRCLQSAG
jgi:hypothetical protein